MQSAAIRDSSRSLNTLPLGFCGEFTMIARVRSVTAARSSSSSKVQSGSWRRT